MTVSKLTPKKLSEAYESICKEYAKRLCDQFVIDYEDCWWVADRVGECFMFSDFSLSFDDVRLLVDSAISFDEFYEWWNACVINSDKCKASVSLRVWLEGYRPDEF